ncbi:MAG: site-specific DNA-methyltransferase [Planctomycetaceae bacterium]|jgi:site-specific DNA-methyltransferase (adenine-specific)|nr:site-specific DNA-methyltransferase [Planctomycetaceae bacterium]
MYKTITRNKELPTFFGKVRAKGKLINSTFENNTKPKLFYQHENGQLWQGDCVEWLKTLPDKSIDLIFADPPYNIKKTNWDTFNNQEEYIKFSMLWIEQAARILKPTGTLFICGFSEILADIKHPASRFFNSCRWIIWHYKNKANLGKDWGRSHESILHFRKTKNFTFNIDNIRIPYGEHTLKYPNHPQAKTSQYGNGKNDNQLWEPNPLGAKPKDVIEIPTTCNGMHEKTPHPTQKPEELLRKLILASSNIGDTIIDPFCGSGTTAVCAEQLQRKWKACDLSPQYLNWTVNRIELVEEYNIETWIKFDFDNLKRRYSIR